MVEGDGFLYKQVRHLVGALLGVASGRLPREALAAALAAGEGADAPTFAHGWRGWDVAEAKGLCLHEVRYPPEWLEEEEPSGVARVAGSGGGGGASGV